MAIIDILCRFVKRIFIWYTLLRKVVNMLIKVLSRFPKWQIDNLKELSKSKGLTIADLIRLSTYFFVLHYKGKYDKETIDKMEFNTRKKIDSDII